MMKITGLSHLFKWENLHNWWLTNTFLPHCIWALEKFEQDENVKSTYKECLCQHCKNPKY